MTNKAKIAVIGTGWWATMIHIPALLQNPDAELVAIADLDAEKLKAASDHYDLQKTYTNFKEMIASEELDGVIISTYHATHYEVAKYCLEHDLHVLIEKPMVLFANHARELTQLAEEHQRQIVIGYTLNFSSHAQRTRQLIQSGLIGDIHYVNCVFGSEVYKYLYTDVQEDGPVHGPGQVYSDVKKSGGGQGHLQATHGVGMMFFLTGLKPQRVHALMNNLGAQVDVADAITVEFENGALGNVGSYGRAGSGSRLDLIIYGEKGNIYFETFTGKVIIHTHDGHSTTLFLEEDSSALVESHRTSANLVDVILGKAENGSDGVVGWRAVELLDAAYRSAALDGQAVHISALYDEGA